MYKDPIKQKEYNKEYYRRNKERIKEYDKQYNEKNKEHRKEYRQKYYLKNKEKIKKRREERKEEIHDYAVKHYEQNREKMIKTQNDYLKQKNAKSLLTAHNHKQLWTPEETEILIRMIKQGKSYKEMSTRLGRTVDSIAIKLSRIRKNGDPFNGNPVDI